MDLDIERFGFARDSTLGELRIDSIHEAFSLEDERRWQKVQGETCIPLGRYQILLRTEGGLHQKYKARFPDFHRGMLWLQDVPNFRWIYIHIGNDDDDTDGCPLVGRHPLILPDGEFKIAASTDAYVALYRKVLLAMDRGEPVWVTLSERSPT